MEFCTKIPQRMCPRLHRKKKKTWLDLVLFLSLYFSFSPYTKKERKTNKKHNNKKKNTKRPHIFCAIYQNDGLLNPSRCKYVQCAQITVRLSFVLFWQWKEQNGRVEKKKQSHTMAQTHMSIKTKHKNGIQFEAVSRCSVMELFS